MDVSSLYQYPYYSVDNINDRDRFQQKAEELADNLLLSEVLEQYKILYQAVSQRARNFHSDIPYHNSVHHSVVTNFAMISALAHDEIDLLPSLIVAGLWHDAGYHEDHQAFGYETKEDLSIDLMKTHEHVAGTDSTIIDIAADAIEGTKIYNDDFSSVGRKILRASDIKLVGSSYDIFIAEYNQIKSEYEEMHGVEVSLKDFATKQTEILQHLLDQQTDVPESYYCMDGKFYERFAHNIDTFRNQYT